MKHYSDSSEQTLLTAKVRGLRRNIFPNMRKIEWLTPEGTLPQDFYTKVTRRETHRGGRRAGPNERGWGGGPGDTRRMVIYKQS